MRMLRVAVLLIAGGLGLLAHAPPAEAQTREETEARLRQLQAQIAEDQSRLSETAEAKRASQKRLEDLNREIALRRELVETYQARRRQMRLEADSLQASLQDLARAAEEHRAAYRARARHAYKHGRLHDVALILAARSINQMIVRVRYLHRFADERREKLRALQSTTRAIEEQQTALQEKRTRTTELLAEAEAERRNLTGLQQSRQQVVQELRAQETSLQSEITERQTAAQQLEARLRQLIAQNTQRQRRSARSSPARQAEFSRLSGSFAQNQGRLPWPSEGVVTENFGTVTNPVHGTKTPNPGVLIATSPQAEVQAVFEGEITAVDALPDLGTTVFVQHGSYTSVYGNFSMLYVGQGDRLEAGQVIGRAGTEGEPRGAGVFFALFKEGEPVDPNTWLKRR